MKDRMAKMFSWCPVLASRTVSIVTLSCPAVAQNCSCSGNNQTLTCWGLAEIPSIAAGPGLDYDLTSFVFIEGNISVLDSSNLPAGLHVLKFHNHPLTNISDDAFDHLTDDLNELIISGAAFRTPPVALLKLRKLEYLEITNSALEDWFSPDFLETDDNNSTLADYFNHELELILTNNELSQIDFSYMPSNTTAIDLNSNKITKIRYSNDSLSPGNFSTFSDLELSRNQITTLSFDDITPNTRTLNLNYNNISEILDSNLTRNMSLRTLYLNFNPIASISPSAFRNLNQLGMLFLQNTRLTSLPLALTSLTFLRNLNLLHVPLSCPCPAPASLVQWLYYSRCNLVAALCENDTFSAGRYLTNYCDTSSTSPTSGTIASTTPHNTASSLSNNTVVVFFVSTVLSFWALQLRLVFPLSI